MYDQEEMLRQTEETLQALEYEQFKLNAFKYALNKAKKSNVPQDNVIAHLEKIILEMEKNNERNNKCQKDLLM